MMNAQTRAWVYRIVLAVVPLLITLGLLTEEVARDILNIAAAVLAVSGSALALKNVTPDEHIIIEWDIDENLGN
jgi:hypothetical protein